MKKDIIIPAAGESVTEADIVSWYKESGDYVEMDEPIVELTVEVWPKRVHGLGRFWGLIACTRYVTRKIQSVYSVACSSDIRG